MQARRGESVAAFPASARSLCLERATHRRASMQATMATRFPGGRGRDPCACVSKWGGMGRRSAPCRQRQRRRPRWRRGETVRRRLTCLGGGEGGIGEQRSSRALTQRWRIEGVLLGSVPPCDPSSNAGYDAGERAIRVRGRDVNVRVPGHTQVVGTTWIRAGGSERGGASD